MAKEQNSFEEEKMMSVREVAAFLHVVPRTVYRLLEERKMPSYKVGKAVRIKLSDLEKYLENHKRA